MSRLTKHDIERELLAGASVKWKDANGKNVQLSLTDPAERRLFQFLLIQPTRLPTDLPTGFIEAISNTFKATDDPAKTNNSEVATTVGGPWRLKSLKTEGFGGLNVWGGKAFNFDLDGESLLLEGANGSGKSSLIGAIVWALSGERPRDQTNDRAHDPHPVFDANHRLAGEWPPIACYPPTIGSLNSPPRVNVELIFQDPQGKTASLTRTLDAGKLSSKKDLGLEIPSTLLEAGVLMPARLASLRLGEREGKLTTAVQKLTGLDDLIAIGILVEGLCHGAREYLSYKKKELAEAKADFNNYLENARNELKALNINVPQFKPSDTDDKAGDFAKLGKTLKDRAAELTSVISSDLSGTLTLTDFKVQAEIVASIATAKSSLTQGLLGTQSWKQILSIASEFDETTSQTIGKVLENAKTQSENALALLKKSELDSKFQLKALAAKWHNEHSAGSIDACPLCEQLLAGHPKLSKELNELKSAGEAAARTFEDNLNAIVATIELSLPPIAQKIGPEILTFEPNSKLKSDLSEGFLSNSKFSKTLVKFSSIIEKALKASPSKALPPLEFFDKDAKSGKLSQRINVVQRVLDIATWYRANSLVWETWWAELLTPPKIEKQEIEPAALVKREGLQEHLARLSTALGESEPYRKSAEALANAWKSGRIASPIEAEIAHRKEIGAKLEPLKLLGSLSESVARNAINELSSRIAVLLKEIFITEQLQFWHANLSKKDGIIVRGGFSNDVQIDATLIANTSWLRAVLWAFLFSLRAEAVEQLSVDPFPVFAFDDPQATFDGDHRHRWAQQVIKLQSSPTNAQVLLTTHDEVFRDLIKVTGVVGRDAVITAANSNVDHVSIFEGDSLKREWAKVLIANSNVAGRDYVKKVREYSEGLLRIMLRGESATVLSVVSGFVIGDSRDKIKMLHEKGLAPWDRSEFSNLVSKLNKSLSAIKHMEISHHSGGSTLGMAEAKDVEEHWRKNLEPALMSSFKQRQQYLSLHGKHSALHAAPPTVALPEGYLSGVKNIPLNILGRAAALSNGRVADGLLDVSNFPVLSQKKITLAQHFAFKLTVPTLEPVARAGDVLLVKKEGEPTPRSLVIAISEDRILARRFELADKNSDIAVLTAHAIDPREIAQPFVAQKASLVLHKIVGVLFDSASWGSISEKKLEVCECEGQATLDRVSADVLGLVEVVGHSAVPIALDKQYLIIRKEILATTSLKHLIGKPVVASDSSGQQYFKRLQIPDKDTIVLESLDIGGDYPPVVLKLSKDATESDAEETVVSKENCLDRVWPVAGILFELP